VLTNELSYLKKALVSNSLPNKFAEYAEYYKRDTELLPTGHLGTTSIRQCTIMSKKTYTENPDERAR
jgi:hypothetical protein